METAAGPAQSIGVLNEKQLHAALKEWVFQPGDLREVPVGGYVVDIVRGDQLIEIQTRNFARIARKLAALAGEYQVRLVHPIAREKWIVKLSEDGQAVTSRRRSPKRGAYEDVFNELVHIPDLVANPAFSVDVVLTREDEYRQHDDTLGWRRRGWVVVERRLIEVVGCRSMNTPADVAALLPDGLADPFSTGDLAKATGRPRRLAQRMAYCLRKLGAITPAGKQGNSILYVRAQAPCCSRVRGLAAGSTVGSR